MALVMLDNHRDVPVGTFIGLPLEHWRPEEYGHGACADFFSASHVVAHWDGDDLAARKAEWEGRAAQALSDIIVLRVSAGAPTDLEHADLALPWSRKEGGKTWTVRLLNCRNHKALSDPAIIGAFYGMSHTDAQAVIDGKTAALPSDLLQRLFSSPVGPMVVTALSILCQGYLAAHCGPDAACEHGFKVDVESDSTEAIGRALRKMKWGDVLRSAQSLAPQLTSSDQLARKPLRDQVSGASFWAVFAQTESSTLAKDAEREWKALRSAGKFAESKTKILIHSLPLKEGALAGEDFGTCVAEAYLELAETLEKSQ